MSAWSPPAKASAETILRQAIDHFAPRVALSCSFGGPGGLVLVHMMSRFKVRIPVVFLDTQFLFPETLALMHAFRELYDVDIRTYRPALTPEQQARAFGNELWRTEPDLCCQMRKVEPMERALDELDLAAWITALRRDQSATRSQLTAAGSHTTASGRQITKVYPLHAWTRQDVWRYIHEHDIPYNPLLDQGYQSLGCTHCTVRVNSSTNGDERAGRWPGSQKTECGLHSRSLPKVAASDA